MARNDSRLIVGFYGNNKTDALQALATLRGQSVKKAWIVDGKQTGNGLPADLQRYRDTLVGEEYLVAGLVNLPLHKPALDKLRAGGEYPTFILRRIVDSTAPTSPSSSLTPVTSLSHVFLSLACQHAATVPVPIGALRRLFREAEGRLTSSYHALMNSALLGHTVTATGEWLLDNNYLFEVHGAEVKAHLPKKFGSRVPGVATSQGLPRVYEIARELTAQLDFAVTEESILAALDAYQAETPLNIAELWLFPVVLRLVLYEGISRIATRAAHAQDTREYAYFWTNRLVAAARTSPAMLSQMLDTLEKDRLLQSEEFIGVLAEQLHEEDLALARFQEKMMNLLSGSLSEVVRRQHQAETADRITVANAIGSLRNLGQIDFTETVVRVSRIEQILSKDPAGNYTQTDFSTRDLCRHSVETLSDWADLPEPVVAQKAVDLAAAGLDRLETHVQYFLIGAGRVQMERSLGATPSTGVRLTRWIHRHPTFTYLSLILFLTCFLASMFAVALSGPGLTGTFLVVLLAVAAAFPLSDFSIQIVNTLMVSAVPPASLPRMDFEEEIPESCRTLVVIPTMLVSQSTLEKELERLETRFVGNRDERLHYAILADFADSYSMRQTGDDALLEAARRGIDSLRQRYSVDRFHLFHREREWSEGEQAWIGRERKRGKIEDLNAMLCGLPAAITSYPPLEQSITFVITLDADTGLPAGSARNLIETIAHPLNRVRISPDGRQRLSGYTIIQPRVSIGLPGASVTRFTRIFADARGTDPYCHAVSDLYQDLFRESIFHGKAIYDVAAMQSLLHDRFPPDTILSHDLIEGAHIGVGADTRIELFENLPADYAGFARRQHRWIRGDWQIAPWILNKVPNGKGESVTNQLPLVNRWQILDNLRRSLVAPFSIFILFLSWLFSPAAGVSTLLIAVAAGLPYLAPVLDRLAKNISRETHGTIGIPEDVQRALVYIALLPHQAWVSLDAIARVLYRRYVSKRRLLEWQTAEAANSSGQHMSATLKECWLISGMAVALMILLGIAGNFLPALPFLISWALCPFVVMWLGTTVPKAYPGELADDDKDYLWMVSRRTWRSFDDLVGPQSNWLPPDNVQLSLRVEIAQRTSPTNIGLWLTSVLAATDFGFITPEDLLERSQKSLATLSGLERYEGHFLNWYSLTTLEPLPPRYVSTVDSGNLLACFWVFQRGLDELGQVPTPGPYCLSGIAATLEALAEVMGKDAATALPLNNLRQLLQSDARGYEIVDRLKQVDLQVRTLKRSLAWFSSEPSEASYWVNKLEAQCNGWLAHCKRFLPWMETLAAAPDQLLRSISPQLVDARLRAIRVVPSLAAMADGSHKEMNSVLELAQASKGTPLSAWHDQLSSEYQRSRDEARVLLEQSAALIKQTDALASAIDMAFLYDRKRKLFGIGYEVGTPRTFSSHYDLLASECRLGSLVAIAKGDVPNEHWHALGRPYVSTSDGQRLLSWSGTMFEYLMPVLFMRPFENSLLAEAARLAVRVQSDYGASLDRPWGVSEAAYSALDANQIYQYRAFGVPQLGLKPGLENDFVVSPYSTLLALQIDSKSAIENLRTLAALNLYGPMGFYEAIDYSRPSSPSDPDGVIIYSYMAHHQGMGLTALANALLDGTMQRRFHEDLRIRSVEALLYERVPTPRSLLRHAREESPTVLSLRPEDVLERNPSESGTVPNVQLLGNGQYSILLTNAGAGYSRWRDFDIGRWRADTILDSHGTFFYVRDLRANTVWSPSLQPLGSLTGPVHLTFSASRVRFEQSINGIDQVYEICVAPDDDVEIRRFAFSNRSLRSRSMDLTSFMELSLAPHAADRAHMAFSKLFVETEWMSDRYALIAKRRPRSAEEPEIWAAHMLVGEVDRSNIEYESSRAEFIGRNRTIRNPRSLQSSLTSSTGTVLDPAFAIRCRFTLDTREKFEVAFLTMAASNREDLLALMEKYAK